MTSNPLSLFDVLPLKGKLEDLPEPTVPYFFVAGDGLFMRRTTSIGVVTERQSEWPKQLKKADIKNGNLKYTAPPIPQSIIERAWGFFKYAFEENQSEAEVLILFDPERKRYRLFAPHQECTIASVHSLYDPADIPNGYQVIGSIHSHCDFGAFHSGVDTDDASSFNGLHITIGHVDRENSPEFAVMVMLNGLRWDYEITNVAATSEKMTPRGFPAVWKNMFGSYTEIAEREFKSLTPDDIKKWTDSRKPKTTFKSSGSSILTGARIWNGYDDDDDSWNWWRSWGPKSQSEWSSDRAKDKAEKKRDSRYTDENKSNLRYCYETRGYVPKHWLDSKGMLLRQYIEEAFELEFARLFDAALTRGFWVSCSINKMDDDTIEKFSDNADEAEIRLLNEGKDYLPGWATVRENEVSSSDTRKYEPED